VGQASVVLIRQAEQLLAATRVFLKDEALVNK
jgi:hypothetical protein